MGMATGDPGPGTESNITFVPRNWTPEQEAAHKAIDDADRRITEIVAALEREHNMTVNEIDVHETPFNGRTVTILWQLKGEDA